MPTWLEPAVLVAPETNYAPRVAMNENGDIAAVWQERAAENAFEGFAASIRNAGSDNPWITTSWPFAQTTAHGMQPVVGIDGAGDALSAWYGSYPGHVGMIGYATRDYSASASWTVGDPPLWDPPENPPTKQEVEVAENEAGDAIAVWRVDSGIRAATRTAGGAWQGIADPLDDLPSDNPSVAIDHNGDAVVTWIDGSVVKEADCSAATASCEDAVGFSDPAEVASQPKVAVDNDGDAVVVWNAVDGANHVVKAARRASGSDFVVGADSVSPADEDAWFPRVGVADDGSAYLIWTDGGKQLRLATGTADGSWSLAPEPLSTSGEEVEAGEARIAANDSGSAVAAWLSYLDGRAVARAATVQAGGSWATGQTISDPRFDQHIADENAVDVGIDREGNAVAVWHGDADLNGDGVMDDGALQAAGFDAAGPRLNDIESPDAGTVGEPLDFGVDTFDVWSAVDSVEWDFGDGSTTSGTNPAHAYAAPGTYDVTVTATDAVGNESVARMRVTISAAAGDGGGGGGSGGGGADDPGAQPNGTESASESAPSTSTDLTDSMIAAVCASVLKNPRVSVTHWKRGPARGCSCASRSRPVVTCSSRMRARVSFCRLSVVADAVAARASWQAPSSSSMDRPSRRMGARRTTW